MDADYPHIVAGRQLANGKREFWITYHRQSGSMALQYLYSGDGGQTWSGAPISVGSAEVIGSFAVPALGSDGALYVSYSAETPEGNEVIRFVRGEADTRTLPTLASHT